MVLEEKEAHDFMYINRNALNISYQMNHLTNYLKKANA
jgi:hypothetical protein